LQSQYDRDIAAFRGGLLLLQPFAWNKLSDRYTEGLRLVARALDVLGQTRGMAVTLRNIEGPAGAEFVKRYSPSAALRAHRESIGRFTRVDAEALVKQALERLSVLGPEINELKRRAGHTSAPADVHVPDVERRSQAPRGERDDIGLRDDG
jgi:hypothetical protein